MSVVAFFECVCCESDVCFHNGIVLARYRGLINNRAGLAVARKWALSGSLTVTIIVVVGVGIHFVSNTLVVR